MRRYFQIPRWLTITLLLASIVGVWIERPLQLPHMVVKVDIPAGATSDEVTQLLINAGVLNGRLDQGMLNAILRLSGRGDSLRAGTYKFTQGQSLRQILMKLLAGRSEDLMVMIVPGRNWREIKTQLAALPHLKMTLAQLPQKAVAEQLGIDGDAIEGWIYPDTYAVRPGSTDADLLKRSISKMRDTLDKAWRERDEGLPIRSQREALVLASIIEKETGKAADRGLIAAVFVNRLKQGMRLQTDPTVIYGLGEAFDGNLHKRDLAADTAYNTYIHSGLPPTAICSPSVDSILAALHPQASNALYFVARGDGSSEFSETLAQHNRAVNQYIRQAR